MSSIKLPTGLGSIATPVGESLGANTAVAGDHQVQTPQ